MTAQDRRLEVGGGRRCGYAQPVSALRIRRLSRRFRGHGGALLAVLGVCAAIAMHHSAVSAGDMHHDGGMAAAVELCLGVIAAGAAAVAVAIAVVGLRQSRPPRILAATPAAVVKPPLVRVRAGPALLSELCVRRR